MGKCVYKFVGGKRKGETCGITFRKENETHCANHIKFKKEVYEPSESSESPVKKIKKSTKKIKKPKQIKPESSESSESSESPVKKVKKSTKKIKKPKQIKPESSEESKTDLYDSKSKSEENILETPKDPTPKEPSSKSVEKPTHAVPVPVFAIDPNKVYPYTQLECDTPDNSVSSWSVSSSFSISDSSSSFSISD